jgi:hypothetical protein
MPFALQSALAPVIFRPVVVTELRNLFFIGTPFIYKNKGHSVISENGLLFCSGIKSIPFSPVLGNYTYYQKNEYVV